MSFRITTFHLAEGVALLVGFIVFIGGLIIVSMRAKNQDDPFVTEACDDVPNDVPTKKAVFWLVIGMILLPVSSHFLIGSAVDIAKYFGLSDLSHWLNNYCHWHELAGTCSFGCRCT